MRQSTAWFIIALLACAFSQTGAAQRPESTASQPAVVYLHPPFPEPFLEYPEEVSPLFKSSPFSASQAEVNQLAPYVYQIAARFQYNEKKFWNARGSAALIRSKGSIYVVTAAHLLQWDSSGLVELFRKCAAHFFKAEFANTKPPPVLCEVWICDYQGRVFPCELHRLLPTLDVATLTVDEPESLGPETIISELELTPPEQLCQPVYLCGWHAGCLFVQRGQAGPVIPWLLIDMSAVVDVGSAQVTLVPGFSGGPVLTQELRLLGVCCSGKKNGEPLSHFASAQSIQRALAPR